MKHNSNKLYDEGCLIIILIVIVIAAFKFIVFSFTEYPFQSWIGLGLIALAYGINLWKRSKENDAVMDVYRKHPDALRAFIYHRHSLFEKMWLKDNLDRYSYNKEQRKAILSVDEDKWVLWECYNKEIQELANEFPNELKDFINKNHLYPSFSIPIDNVSSYNIKRLSLSWSQQIIDNKCIFDTIRIERRKYNEILTKYPSGTSSYRALYPSSSDKEIVENVDRIRELESFSNTAKEYDYWEERQSNFENESYYIAKEKLPNHGRYIYKSRFIKKDNFGNNIEGTYKFWQIFMKSYSSADDLDYTYSPEYKEYNDTIVEFATYNRYYLDHIYTNVLNFIMEIKTQFKDVVVLFVNNNQYDWNPDVFQYHYIKLKSRLWKNRIEYCDAENITKKATYYVVVDFVTRNDYLINICSKIISESEETKPCIVSYSFIKDYDKNEMSEILNQERKQKGIEEIIIDPENKYDNVQQDVIELSNGRHLVLAPPGCGKTTILAERTRLALKNGIKPEDMLCLTFTNRASRNMIESIGKFECDSTCEMDKLFVGNIHKFATNYLLTNNIISQTSAVIDEIYVQNIILKLTEKEESETLLDFLDREELSVYTKIQNFMCQIRSGHDSTIIINDTIKVQDSIEFSSSIREQVCNYYHVDNILEVFDSIEKLYAEEHPSQLENILYRLLIAHRYESYKHTHDMVDFDDLLILAYNAIKKEHHHSYKWIQVDEVQDLNRLQLAIIDELSDKSSEGVILYLGDEQQAIFSFIGAKVETIKYLKELCGNKIHRLSNNYRSPKYLLDIFNTYAEEVLEVNRDLLPVAIKSPSKQCGDLRLIPSYSNETEIEDITKIIRDTVSQYPDERIAVIVPNNNSADNLSRQLYLNGIDHFKISGNDVFCHQTIKTILSHLNVLYQEQNFVSWSYLLKNMNVFRSYSETRSFLTILRENSLSPVDLLNENRKSYLTEFVETYFSELIIFDTETTGLNVYEDDIVQIAAIKLCKGKKVSTFNVILETKKTIKEYLGNKINPLVDLYNNSERLGRKEGLKAFIDFVGKTPVLAHNARFDYNILYYNLLKYCNIDLSSIWGTCLDSLKIIKLLEPKLRSYRLENLLVSLNLEGTNSHLADDDIIATLSLVRYCYNKASMKLEAQAKFLQENTDVVKKFSQVYSNLYFDSLSKLYDRNPMNATNILEEFSNMYDYLTNQLGLPSVEKIDYVKSFIGQKFQNNDSPISLHEQLEKYLIDLNTYREADLCDESNVSNNNKIFVSTVHKAKGLEFETVIIMSVNDDVYPYWPNTQKPDGSYLVMEDARKLYVALTRAKQRLYLFYYGQKTIFSKRWNKHFTHQGEPSRFIRTITRFFE